MNEFIKEIWKPGKNENIEIISGLIRGYTNNSRAFVIYESGTIVISDKVSHRTDAEYDATLFEVSKNLPDFSVQQTKDENYLVRFLGPITCLILKEDFFLNKEKIVKNIDSHGLFSGESIIYNSHGDAPNDHNYIGLYARAKLFSDICSLRIVRKVP